MKSVHNSSTPGAPSLRIEIEREARRMAGYWHGKRISEAFLIWLKRRKRMVVHSGSSASCRHICTPRMIHA